MPNDESTFDWIELVIRSTHIRVMVFAYLHYLYSNIVLYTMINIHPTHHSPESAVSQDTTSTLLTHAICKRR